MKYFVANGFSPNPLASQKDMDGSSTARLSRNRNDTRESVARRYKKFGVPLPRLGETVFLRDPKCGRISVFVYGPYEAFILIVSRSQRRAYLLGNALRAATTCFIGSAPGNNYNAYLLEISCTPTPDMSQSDLAMAITASEFPYGRRDLELEVALGSGTGLDHFQLASACKVVGQALEKPTILDALLNLEYSRLLVWGFMVGSFYESHYSLDRREFTRYQLERIYLENRFRYDSAFVSAFRGIECVLGKPHFKRSNIPELLAKTDRKYGTTFASARHRSYHEVFSTGKKWWCYKDLIAYYLKLRNAVSAHGNPSPPHIVMEDQVFEIQYFLQSILTDILIPEKQ